MIPKPNDVDFESSKEHLARTKAEAIRLIMRECLEIHKWLKIFNSTFSPFIIVGIGYIFIMCVVIFFTVIKVENRSFLMMVVYFGNGGLILMRFVFALSN